MQESQIGNVAFLDWYVLRRVATYFVLGDSPMVLFFSLHSRCAEESAIDVEDILSVRGKFSAPLALPLSTALTHVLMMVRTQGKTSAMLKVLEARKACIDMMV